MIPTSLAVWFPPALKQRGEVYHAQGRVRIDSAQADHLGAWVSGTEEYRVEIDSAPGALIVSCSCPYALDYGVCKHLWALALEADATGRIAPLLADAGPKFKLLADDDGDSLDPVDPPAPAERSPEVSKRATQPKPKAARPAWRNVLDTVRRQMLWQAGGSRPPDAVWPANRRLVYVIDVPASRTSHLLAISLETEKRLPTGEWQPPKRMQLHTAAWTATPDEADRRIAQMLLGAKSHGYVHDIQQSGFLLDRAAIDVTLRAMCETGRCRLRLVPNERPTDALQWDNGAPWRVVARLARGEDGRYEFTTLLERDGEQMPLSEPSLMHAHGVLVARGLVSRLAHEGSFAFIAQLRDQPALTVEAKDLGALLESLHTLPRLPQLDLPPEAQVRERRDAPVPTLDVQPDPAPWRQRSELHLGFRYGDVHVAPGTEGATLFDKTSLTLHHRIPDAEQGAVQRLMELGAKRHSGAAWRSGRHTHEGFSVGDGKLRAMVAALLADGWQVSIRGVRQRAPTATRASVTSGIDWFDLEGVVSYDGHDVPLRALIEARRRDEESVALADGSQGMLPTDWLARLDAVLAGAKVVDGKLRYQPSQIALLDALLAAMPEATADETFERARAELQRFSSVAPADAPATFEGTLRPYQREGLGWLRFLERFRLGGVLADDMGLGKTVQVLALLEARRTEQESRGARGSKRRPSIVVVPRSLVFNWMHEAARFTPALRLLDHTGANRRLAAIDPQAVDVVLTTYGTLRSDAASLAAIPFDYAILDEAQAIKTASSASAKAARLLVADHRLAMSGTPIENRLEELWSLCEFLNPGMFGGATGFSKLVRGTGGDALRDANRELIARAMRPIILRRTKEQVARDLPKRTEQTLLVDLEGAQRKAYDALLAATRRSVLERVDRLGMGKSRMHILEALLRLRQTACHPVLADARKSGAPSAKLDALLPALEEVVAEGHKALVFSQFTSFLALLRERLDAAGIAYEYLDGKVKDRQQRVERFQREGGAPLFLISLKAGGHGLNLTTADYVYLLDPWWNPAVEAQAIDRAHRIGQRRQVIATRLVARGTIEEKILALQASKRALADAILGEDQGVLAGIGREELEMLLG